MTNKYFNKLRLDVLLETFSKVPGGRVDKALIFDDAPEDYASAVAFLVEEGYLKEDKYCFEITYKGKAFFEQGGFVGEYRHERLLFYCTVVAAVTGVIGVLLSVVALLR